MAWLQGEQIYVVVINSHLTRTGLLNLVSRAVDRDPPTQTDGTRTSKTHGHDSSSNDGELITLFLDML